MKKRLISMVTKSVGLTTFLIWVLTLPSLIVLGYLLAIKEMHWINEIASLYVISLPTSTLALWSIVLLPINLLCLFTFVLSIIVTERGRTMKSREDTQKKTFSFTVHENLEHSTNQTDKPPTQKR